MSDSISGLGEDGGWEHGKKTKKDSKGIKMGDSQSNVNFHSRSQKKNKFLTIVKN